MKHCQDCEPAQEIHWVAYMSVVFGMASEPIFCFLELFFKNTAEAVSQKISFPFYRLTTFLKLGYYSYEPDARDTWRTKCFWAEAKKRNIKMYEYHLGPIRDIFIAEYKNPRQGGASKKITFSGLPRPEGKEADSLNWMDNKGIMKEKFLKEGIPVARGDTASTYKKALQIFNSISKPVITKPNLGSRSRHTMIHLNTREDLKIGFYKARKLSPLVVVEEELSGSLFRGTLVGGKLVGVVRRDPPQVLGDGIHTVQELWKKENERPERGGPIFHKIIIDTNTEKEFVRQNVTLESIPEKGKIITFSQKTSRGSGGTTTEVTDIIHPENIEMLEHLGTYLKDPLVGVDFIIEDITQSWRKQKNCGIIECNSMPFIDLHHYPLFGQPNNIAAKLWDLVIENP
jgi:D-alanine-D-alanine ligase-like ATP-grasp enzyme